MRIPEKIKSAFETVIGCICFVVMLIVSKKFRDELNGLIYNDNGE